MAQVREERIRAEDGHEFTGHLVIPDAGTGAGIIVIQEIFGLTDYIKGVCTRLSGLGYVALAPALYSRIEPDVALDERRPDSLPQAFGMMQRLDVPRAVGDAVAALDHLRTVPEVRDARAGIIGFCLGGGIAYLVAADADPDVAVCYYGSAIPSALDKADSVRCPVLFEFGDADEYISAEQREAVRVAFAGRPHTEFHVHSGANHAFDNHNAAMFHHPEAAARAWEETKAFLGREFPA
ncbi:MAG: dienelactone hydrolase family protein [Candidatus Dormiibacterota bacterium]